MSVINLNGLAVSKNSYQRARKIVDNKQEGANKTGKDVLNSLRKMMPGWTIETSSANWSEGFRNIEICEIILDRMANCPESMVRYKALIFDYEDMVPELEEWARQNEGKSLEFGITIDANGVAKAEAIVRTLMGGEVRTVFDLTPDDKPTWADLIRQKLDSLNEGQIEEADGSKSWVG